MNSPAKPKRKAKQKSFFQYLVDEYILFRREFYFETNTSPENLAQALHSLKGNFSTFRRILSELDCQGDTWQFELVLEDMQKGGGYTQIVKATGLIYENDSSPTTWLEGTIICDPEQYYALIIIMIAFFVGGGIFSLLVWSSSFMGLWLNLIVITAGSVWFRMYFNHRYLFKLIENAVESSHEHSDKAKAS